MRASSAQERRRRDQIGEREKVDEPRRAEILLADVERGERPVVQAGREAEAVGDDHRADDGSAEAAARISGRAARRLVAPAYRRDDAEREDQLPSERIEEPAARLRPIRQMKIEQSDRQIGAARRRQGKRGLIRASARINGDNAISTT